MNSINMANKELNYLLKYLPVDNKKRILKNSQSTADIITAIIKQHIVNRKDAQKIANYFKADTLEDTVFNVWQFLKDNVPYKIESGHFQSVKTLGRILSDAKHSTGNNDCKAYSTFCGSIFEALKIPFIYRFASYNGKEPTHVYTVAYVNNKEIVCDAVLSNFDTEKNYTNKIDKKVMSLYQVSGFEPSIPAVNGKGRIKKALKKVVKKVTDVGKKIVQKTKTVSLTIPRNAFLLLVRLNVHGLGTKIHNLDIKKGFEGLKFWLDLGGDRTALRNAAEAGSKLKSIFGDNDMLNEDNTLGIEPVSTATALASAAPILIIVKKVLSENGILDANEKVNYSNVVEKAKGLFTKKTGTNVTDVVYSSDNTGTNSPILDSKELKDNPRAATTSNSMTSYLPLAALALGVYVYSKNN